MKELFYHYLNELDLPQDKVNQIKICVENTLSPNGNYDLMHREEGDVEYFSIDLLPESRKKLLDTFWDDIPYDWIEHGKIYGKHMTIYYGDPRGKRDDIVEYLETHLGNEVELTVTEIGVSDKAIAVTVEGDFITNNDHAHITLAIPAGSKAKFSNQIENWYPVEPFTLTGKISYTLFD